MAQYDKSDLERRMAGAVESLRGDLSGLRTGRANVMLLDPVTVTVYGASMPLNQVATVSAPEPRMLSVQVWDKTNVGPVEPLRCTSQPPKDIAAAHDDAQLESRITRRRNLACDTIDGFRLDAELALPHQDFTGQLQQDALVGRPGHRRWGVHVASGKASDH